MKMQIAQALMGQRQPRKRNPVAEALMARMMPKSPSLFAPPESMPYDDDEGGQFIPPSQRDPGIMDQRDPLGDPIEQHGPMGRFEWMDSKKAAPAGAYRVASSTGFPGEQRLRRLQDILADPAQNPTPQQIQEHNMLIEQWGDWMEENDPSGFNDGPDPDQRQGLIPKSRFDDARAFQTADLAGIDANRIAAQPAYGGDNVQSRRLADQEVAYRDAMNGLSGILEELNSNPDLLDSAHTWTGRGATGLLRLRDRSGIDAFDLSPEEEQKLGDTTAYKQELLTRVNQYIKDITGAQVGQGDETKRLMAVQANEGDSPTQVVAKITNALDLARLDIARRVYMQRTNGEAPSDRELREILKNRGRELYETAIQSGMSPNEARMKAASDLSQEFGL